MAVFTHDPYPVVGVGVLEGLEVAVGAIRAFADEEPRSHCSVNKAFVTPSAKSRK